jgi:hypothetical protein
LARVRDVQRTRSGDNTVQIRVGTTYQVQRNPTNVRPCTILHDTPCQSHSQMPILRYLSLHLVLLPLPLLKHLGVAQGWLFNGAVPNSCGSRPTRVVRHFRHHSTSVDVNSLMEMDVVVYSENEGGKEGSRLLGAVQSDGRVTPLSAWTDEPAFGDSLEFVVDEADLFPGFQQDDERITIHSIVPEASLSYGSRQLFGGKGPGNPHGEESEVVYYVERSSLRGVDLRLKPELEILW